MAGETNEGCYDDLEGTRLGELGSSRLRWQMYQKFSKVCATVVRHKELNLDDTGRVEWKTFLKHSIYRLRRTLDSRDPRIPRENDTAR